MADQDFNIKVVTTADTSGLQQTSQKLKELREQARQDVGAAALFARIPPGGPTPPATPATTAAASESDRLAGHIETSFVRTATHAAGIGFIFELISGLRKASEEIERISAELDKVGNQIIKNAQLQDVAATHAGTQAEGAKTTAAALKDAEEAQARLNALAKEDLSVWAKISDFINVQVFKNKGKTTGDYEAARQAQLAIAEQNVELANTNAMYTIQAEKVHEARRANQTLEESIQEITDRIRAQETLADIHYRNGDPGSYLAATRNAEAYKKELADIIKLEQERVNAAEKSAAPLAKDLGTPTAKFEEQQQSQAGEHERERAALEQKRREAEATGDTEGAKAIEDKLKHDTYTRDQQKEYLQRYIANQESLADRVPGSNTDTEYGLQKLLGKEGLRKYKLANDALREIYGQEREERGGSNGNTKDAETHILLQKLLDIWQ